MRIVALPAVVLATAFIIGCARGSGNAELDPSFALAPADLGPQWVSVEPVRIDNDESGPAIPGCVEADSVLRLFERYDALKIQQVVARMELADAIQCMTGFAEFLLPGNAATLPSFGIGDEDAVFADGDDDGRIALFILIRVGNVVTDLVLSYDPDLREARAIAEAAAQKIREALAAER